jgi:hypothetical protein
VTSIKNIPLRFPNGPMDWSSYGPWWRAFMRDELRLMDIRDQQQEPVYGRTAILPTLVTYIGNTGRAASQRFMHPLYAANRNSVQNIDTVITATSGASDSTITIASHSVKFDFGTVAYNSGSIAGLLPVTLYYVYADDPEFAGGAVSYLVTTNPDNLIAQGRYYVGFVTTPVTSSSANVSAATSANPIQITTSAAHGYSNGQTVTFASMPGDFGTNLNGNNYVITYINSTQFSIPVDGITYVAYGGGGTVTRVTTATLTGGGAGAGVSGKRFDYVQ